MSRQLNRYHEQIYETLKNGSHLNSTTPILHSDLLHHHQNQIIRNTMDRQHHYRARSHSFNSLASREFEKQLSNRTLLGKIDALQQQRKILNKQASQESKENQPNHHRLRLERTYQCDHALEAVKPRPNKEISEQLLDYQKPRSKEKLMDYLSIPKIRTIRLHNRIPQQHLLETIEVPIRPTKKKIILEPKSNQIPIIKDQQTEWLDKIKRRIQVSKNIFVDSAHRNKCHETAHLQNSFAKETAERRCLKQKICAADQQRKQNSKKLRC